VKTLQSVEEKRVLLRILGPYCTHIKSRPLSFLCRFYGLHRIRTMARQITKYFVVMDNILRNPKITWTYDLKGSLVGRNVPLMERTLDTTLKDEDLRQSGHKFKVGARKGKIVAALAADSKLLCSHNIMDYSLILGVYQRTPEDLKRRVNFENESLKMLPDGGILSEDGKQVYYMGIIDILQTWDKRKKYSGIFPVVHLQFEEPFLYRSSALRHPISRVYG